MRISAAIKWNEDLDDWYREGARKVTDKDMNKGLGNPNEDEDD